MPKKPLDLKKILTPTDAFAVLVILIGLLIAIFIPEIAIRLIGISVALLGGVALFMLISQRLSEIVESRYPQSQSSPPIYTVSVKKDENAKTTVIEDFDTEFRKSEEPTIDPDLYDVNMGQDEGFRVKSEKEEPKEKKIESEIKTYKASETEDKDFNDEFSSVRIIGRRPADEIKRPRTQSNKLNTNHLDPDSTQIKNEPIKEHDKENKESQHDSEPEQAKKNELSVSVFFDDLPVHSREPRKEFEFFQIRVLRLIKEYTKTTTASFFLVNLEREELILQQIVSEKKEKLKTQTRYRIAGDIISQIVKNQKPQILSEINPSAVVDLVPYYKEKAGIGSLIGVPVFYNNAVIGVLCADSEATDAYDSYSVEFLGKMTRLIAGLVHSYTDKYDLLQASRTLEAIKLFNGLAGNKSLDVTEIMSIVVESCVRIIECSRAGVISYDDSQGEWIINALFEKDNKHSVPGTPVDLGNSLAGKSIAGGSSIFRNSPDANDIRVHHREENLENGVFLSVPLKSIGGTYGAIYLEDIKAGSITSYDIDIVETIADQAAKSIEKLYFIDMLNSSSLIDYETGILSQRAFFRRIEEELFRYADLKQHFSLVVVKIDKYHSFNKENYSQRAEKMLQSVLGLIKSKIRPFDVFGKADTESFGIVLINTPLSAARMWAEKIRNEVAITPIEIEGRSFNVTISSGITGSEKINSVDTLIENAQQALQTSLSKTNTVSVFS